MLSQAEERIQELLRRGAQREAATALIEEYGHEVYGFLVATLRVEADAEDVFATICESAWKGLAAFEARSSVRTWLYALARNTARSHRRSARGRARGIPLSQAGDPIVVPRTRTQPYFRSHVRDRFQALRESLSAEDRTLLVLRVERAMSWNEVALVLVSDQLSDQALARATARLRKRFQLIKKQLRQQARRSGLLSDEGP